MSTINFFTFSLSALLLFCIRFGYFDKVRGCNLTNEHQTINKIISKIAFRASETQITNIKIKNIIISNIVNKITEITTSVKQNFLMKLRNKTSGNYTSYLVRERFL